MIEGLATEGDPGPATVIDRLLSFIIIEPIPDATASFELTAPVQNVLSLLLREHRLTSTKTIASFMTLWMCCSSRIYPI